MNFDELVDKIEEAEASVETTQLTFEHKIRPKGGKTYELTMAGDYDNLAHNHPIVYWENFGVKGIPKEGKGGRSLAFQVFDLEQIKHQSPSGEEPDIGLILRKYGDEKWSTLLKKPTVRGLFLCYEYDNRANSIDPSQLRFLDAPRTLLAAIRKTYQSAVETIRSATKNYNSSNEEILPFRGLTFKIVVNNSNTQYTVEILHSANIVLEGELYYDLRDNYAFLSNCQPTREATLEVLKNDFPAVYAEFEEALAEYAKDQEKLAQETEEAQEDFDEDDDELEIPEEPEDL